MEFKKVCNLTIYTGEDVLYEDKPLYKAILLKAREIGLAGGTVVKGQSGFAKAVARRMNDNFSKFFSGNYNAPIVITIVDNRDRIEKLLPFLEEHAEHSYVTLAETEVLITKYLKEKFKDEV